MTPEQQKTYDKAREKILAAVKSTQAGVPVTRLELYGMGLVALPPEIGQLTALTELLLHGNRLKALPPEIGHLTALTLLILIDNQLTALPPEIGQLTALEILTLEENKLRELPESLRQLANLRELTLHGNDALGLPAGVLGPIYVQSGGENPPAKPQEILDYYFARKIQGEAPMQEVRVLLVGRGRVGKTSLLRVLEGGKADLKERETPGITVRRLAVDCPQGRATAHVWDFGGQEFLHGTHQIFLSERCVYVLVLEGREGNWEAETDYWIRFIQSFGGDSPVLVALNKHDEHSFSVDRHRLMERCPQIAGFVCTDAMTGRGIAELRDLLVKTVAELKDVWLGVPRKWHRIKEALEGTAESFLEYADFRALCGTHEVAVATEQDSLAQTLHRLGIALNFREHHRLQHTSVLKPHWVTNAIYGLIRYTQSRESHGVLRSEWLPEALQPAKDYPPGKHAFVVDLMERFEVAFALRDGGQSGGTSWLIPELLGEEQPEPFVEFRGPAVKRLRFSYPEALPPGLLPRLIVRTHEMSEAHPQWRWRSGVVLEWGGSRALVRLDRTLRQTLVQVIDRPLEDRQSLFDLIRAHLTVLHGKVRVLEEVELDGHPDTWVSAGKLRLLENRGTQETMEQTKEGELATVKVTPTLDSVESREARAADRDDAPPRMKLFVSYAHDDVRKIRPLSKHLTILGERGYIQTWQDTQLVAGELWEDRIMEELGQADIVLLLYSTASRASKFIQKTEGPGAVSRAREKENPCTLIVVPLDRKDWDASVPLEKDLKTFQAATWNAEPVLKFTPQTDGWQEVEHAIREAVKKRRSKRKSV